MDFPRSMASDGAGARVDSSAVMIVADPRRGGHAEFPLDSHGDIEGWRLEALQQFERIASAQTETRDEFASLEFTDRWRVL